MIDAIDYKQAQAQAPTLFPMDGTGKGDGGDAARAASRKMRSGGSQNPIVFNDYESFIKKFTEKPKTTDECWTPKDVYEAVVRYVDEVVTPLDGKQILRPFYPGGDYEHADYPEDGVVIDNPPFSIFSKICRFYMAKGVPFFLFGPGLTIMSACKHGCTAVFTRDSMTFTNGAVVRCNFASNLYGGLLAVTAPRLGELLEACPSQRQKVGLPSYEYPANLLSASDMQTLAKSDEAFAVPREACVIARRLDGMPKGKTLFGDHYLLADDLARAKEKAKEKAKERAKERAKAAIHVELSARERAVVDRLNGRRLDDDRQDRPL